jgi:hypothetical protein
MRKLRKPELPNLKLIVDYVRQPADLQYPTPRKEWWDTFWKVVLCAIFGHDLEESVRSTESGHTDLSCHRCGWSTDYYMS